MDVVEYARYDTFNIHSGNLCLYHFQVNFSTSSTVTTAATATTTTKATTADTTTRSGEYGVLLLHVYIFLLFRILFVLGSVEAESSIYQHGNIPTAEC